MKELRHIDLVLDREGDQNSFFSLHYTVDNGHGMGYGKIVSFIGKKLEDVQEFFKGLREELEGCDITFRLYAGRGDNAKRIWMHSGKPYDGRFF